MLYNVSSAHDPADGDGRSCQDVLHGGGDGAGPPATDCSCPQSAGRQRLHDAGNPKTQRHRAQQLRTQSRGGSEICRGEDELLGEGDIMDPGLKITVRNERAEGDSLSADIAEENESSEERVVGL